MNLYFCRLKVFCRCFCPRCVVLRLQPQEKVTCECTLAVVAFDVQSVVSVRVLLSSLLSPSHPTPAPPTSTPTHGTRQAQRQRKRTEAEKGPKRTPKNPPWTHFKLCRRDKNTFKHDNAHFKTQYLLTLQAPLTVYHIFLVRLFYLEDISTPPRATQMLFS